MCIGFLDICVVTQPKDQHFKAHGEVAVQYSTSVVQLGTQLFYQTRTPLIRLKFWSEYAIYTMPLK